VNAVQIEEAIQSSDWLEVECLDRRNETSCSFRLRILGFEPAENCKLIDEEALSKITLEGNPWILHIEVVNTLKESFSREIIYGSLSLVDSDGFRFDPCDRNNLYRAMPALFRRCRSPFAPKIKASAAIVFFLPDQETCYGLSSRNGTIRKS